MASTTMKSHTLRTSTVRGQRAGFSRPVVPATPSQRCEAQRVIARAAQSSGSPGPKDPLLSFSAAIGLPADEGLFGFRPFSELWCGRLAMMGFITSIVEEFLTGEGTLMQMHLMQDGAPDVLVLGALCALFGGATIYATFDTLAKLRAKKLTEKDVARYKSFLALNSDKDARLAAAAMKARPDFATPGNDWAAINSAKAQGAPVDAFLSTSEVAEGEAAARAMKASEASSSSSSPASSEQEAQLEAAQKRAAAQAAEAANMLYSGNAEMRYAQEVEMSNGRAAMLGFLAAVLVEAGTGQGIIGQLFMYAKLSGLLGPDSGF